MKHKLLLKLLGVETQRQRMHGFRGARPIERAGRQTSRVHTSWRGEWQVGRSVGQCVALCFNLGGNKNAGLTPRSLLRNAREPSRRGVLQGFCLAG